MSSHFATPRKPQPPTFWVEPATQKPADNPELDNLVLARPPQEYVRDVVIG